jgi:hypothetical protein
MPASEEHIDSLVREILARDEFASLKSGGSETQLLGELFESLLNAIQAVVGDLRANHPGIFIALLIVGATVLSISIWYGARGAARRSLAAARVENSLVEILRGDPRKLRDEAVASAGNGRFLDAVRLLFRATIIEQALAEGTLERIRDAEDFRRARTYRELIQEFARSSARLGGMQRTATRIEEGLYAGKPITERDYQRALAELGAQYQGRDQAPPERLPSEAPDA